MSSILCKITWVVNKILPLAVSHSLSPSFSLVAWANIFFFLKKPLHTKLSLTGKPCVTQVYPCKYFSYISYMIRKIKHHPSLLLLPFPLPMKEVALIRVHLPPILCLTIWVMVLSLTVLSSFQHHHFYSRVLVILKTHIE